MCPPTLTTPDLPGCERRGVTTSVGRAPRELARVRLDVQRHAVAADELDRVLAPQPDQIEALLLRGLTAYYAGALNTASASWDRAAVADPADRRVAVYRSMLARKQGGPLEG
jgi:Tfp pilus assembly protein PilF